MLKDRYNWYNWWCSVFAQNGLELTLVITVVLLAALVVVVERLLFRLLRPRHGHVDLLLALFHTTVPYLLPFLKLVDNSHSSSGPVTLESSEKQRSRGDVIGDATGDTTGDVIVDDAIKRTPESGER